MKIKLMKQITFFGLSLLFVTPSCTIEKRVHNSGYHIEWQRKNSDFNHPSIAYEKGVQEFSKSHKKGNKDNYFDVNYSTLNLIENRLPESLNLTYASIFSKEKFIFRESNTQVYSFPLTIAQGNIANKVEGKGAYLPKITHANLVKKNLENFSKVAKKDTSSETNNEQGALKALGWIVLILGILILLFASILGGLLIMLLGLLAIVAGKKDTNSPKSDEKNESNSYSDIVYLKNGSVIKGQILEQVPNVQLKIQTKDGSMFVYKMEEVEKITKEVSK